MSATISNIDLDNTNYISHLFMEGDIIIDLLDLFPDTQNITLGYYFADDREKIIAGKVIDLAKEKQNKFKTWITIPVSDIPQNAVTLSFFSN